MRFEPRSIALNFSMMAVVGGAPLMFESASPELEGSFHTDWGAHGTVTIPLTASERVALRAIVESATERAVALATEVASGR